MPRLIAGPTVVPAVGEPAKRIEEFFGRVNDGTSTLSVARMTSPPGWAEPGQRPAFDEYTLVLSGTLEVESESGRLSVSAGQAVHTVPGEWVRYSTPCGATYVAICVPAFSPHTVHRDS